MQQRLSDILSSCGSPGSLFNDPNSSDVKLTLTSKDGLSVYLNVHMQILVAHIRFSADKLVDIRRNVGQQGQQLRGLIDHSNLCIVEIADCDDIEVYIDSIRLMYCKDLRRKLMKDDVPRVLGILKVSECLEYLEAAPWAEDDEEKISSLLSELQLEGVNKGVAEAKFKEIMTFYEVIKLKERIITCTQFMQETCLGFGSFQCKAEKRLHFTSAFILQEPAPRRVIAPATTTKNSKVSDH